MTTNPTNGHEPTSEPETTHSAEMAGGREPRKQTPGQMDEDDTKRKRGGGDVERDVPEEQGDGGSTRRGDHSRTDEEENGGGSREKPGRSRNM